MRYLILAPVAVMAVATVLISCDPSGQTGACPGLEDGSYYNLEFNNYTQAGVQVNLNGRLLGEVSAAKVISINTAGVDAVQPGYTNFGALPACSQTSISFDGPDTSGSTYICATSAFTSSACLAHRPEYCYLTIIGLNAAGDLIPAGSAPPTSTNPECPTDGPCANAFFESLLSCDQNQPI